MGCYQVWQKIHAANYCWTEVPTWKYLKDVKESNPIEVAEYVTAQRIQDDPAFAWWVPFTLKN